MSVAAALPAMDSFFNTGGGGIGDIGGSSAEQTLGDTKGSDFGDVTFNSGANSGQKVADTSTNDVFKWAAIGLAVTIVAVVATKRLGAK